MTVFELLRKYEHIIETDLDEATNLLYDGELDYAMSIAIEASAQIKLMNDVIDCISKKYARKEWHKRFDWLNLSYEELYEQLIEEMNKQRNEE